MKKWGKQTELSLQFFDYGKHNRVPIQFIHCLLDIKMAMAEANYKAEKLSLEKCNAIKKACKLILDSDKYNDRFVTSYWQTGSGTQIHMNVNEVVGLLASTAKLHVDPHDDVNMSMSSNDVIPTALQIFIWKENKALCAELENWLKTIKLQSEKFQDKLKIGRTHLQNGLPVSYGQIWKGYYSVLYACLKNIQKAMDGILELPLGGTAVGTGVHTSPTVIHNFIKIFYRNTGMLFRKPSNYFYLTEYHSNIQVYTLAVYNLATVIYKTVNDIRFMSSNTYSEIKIPENEPGSSIMPGKVNPTQCEALLMICVQVFGNQSSIDFACSQGNFELNVFKPLLLKNVNENFDLLTQGIGHFNKFCMKGIKPIEDSKKIFDNPINLTLFSETYSYDVVTKMVRLWEKIGFTKFLEKNKKLDKKLRDKKFLIHEK